MAGLRDLFPPHALFSAQDVPHPKLDPALLQHAAATMNAEPSACVVIEDTPQESWLLSPPGCGLSATVADSDERALREPCRHTLRSACTAPYLPRPSRVAESVHECGKRLRDVSGSQGSKPQRP